jgi:hypothetical protein
LGGNTLKTVYVYFYKIDSEWTAYTKDFGVGYAHKKYDLARERILDGIHFYYEPQQIEIVEQIVSEDFADELWQKENLQPVKNDEEFVDEVLAKPLTT